MREGIIAGGNWILDRVKMIDEYPPQDALTTIRSESVSNGGAAFNVLTDLVQLGFPHPLAGIGLVGDDPQGEYILEQCRGSRIETSRIRKTSEAPTSYTDVMTVQGTGRRTFFHCRGANALLEEEYFDFSETSFKHFHLGYLLLLDRLDQPHADGTVAGHVLRRALEAGVSTSVDVVSESSSNFRAVVLPTLPHVDICFMNEFEAERCTGVPLASPTAATLREAATKLLNVGVRKWVVIHYEDGAYACGPSGDSLIGRIELPGEMIKGMVGAGDAFAAGVLYGWHAEYEIEKCLEYGVCAAASCLQDATASGGVRDLTECLDMGRRFGFAHPIC